MLGYPTVNLGVPGSSCLLQWSNTLTLINNNVKPRGVIYLWPNICRTTTFTRSGLIDQHGQWSKKNVYKFWVNNVEHCLELTSRLIDSVDLMWSCPTYHFHLDKDVCEKIPKLKYIETKYALITDLARDYERGGAHPGPKSNFDWANQMYDLITRA
jgi:hypothetical protein